MSWVLEDDGSNPILLNKRRKPIINGDEKVHWKPIRGGPAPSRFGLWTPRRRDGDVGDATSTTNVCFPPAPLVRWLVEVDGLLMGE